MTSSEAEEKKSSIAKMEEEILEFWRENKIFEKSLAQNSPKGEFVFYDGPPFATGLPHYGHLLAGTIKDVIPRYKTMRGYHVRRRWGWDCHGLPVENLIEKELGLKNKKDIENFGLAEFNKKARESVLRYVDEWKKIVPRLGRFVDMEDDYRTMDPTYTETIWCIFKTLFDKGLIYEGYKSMHICPRCETTLSNFEVTQGYKDVTDISVTAKFELVDEPGTYLLAWTTTPWTLPGNVALAVNPKVIYVKIKIGDDFYILAKERIESVVKEKFEQREEFKGSDLLGKKYKPVFENYINDGNLSNRENGWKVYSADFVTTEDGTGIVHIAPAFGEVDMALGQKENLPFVQHVDMSGNLKPEMGEFAGQKVKPIENPQATDIEIIKYLATRGFLFAKEKIVHPYPHCWRCATPLLNYATSSWFVRVTELKDKLVAANREIKWIPANFRDGRFGKWLEGARDWAISRSRFWGAPLPVWRCEACGQKKIVGSLAELSDLKKGNLNRYFFMRHGEADSNVADFISVDPNGPNHLTERGREEVLASAKKLIGEKIDFIFSSDFIRTKETAKILANEINLTDDKIIFDKRLRELDIGNFSGQTWSEYDKQAGSLRQRFETLPETGGENYTMVRDRVMSFLFEIENKYQNKNFLIISHGLPLFIISSTLKNLSIDQMSKEESIFKTGEFRQFDFKFQPRNENYELDLHRPYIDQITFPCACGGQMKRIPEVFDCWFESGAMPYGQDHYPFEKNKINPEQSFGFPADFIAEGQDQTRGWFYSLLVLGVGLFGQSPYKQVVSNGMILAEDGQKMSKKLKNYPDPLEVVSRYGADALRFYLLSSPAVRAEDLNFSEKGVAEIYRKNIARLLNVLSFFSTYVEKLPIEKFDARDLENILDKWILARLGGTITEVGRTFDNYEIDRSLRPIEEFIEDLSTWYLRRSRDRFKSEDEKDRFQAVMTTCHILRETAKLIAPICPFLAEYTYQCLKSNQDVESVHLAPWPTDENNFVYTETSIGDEMAEARRIVSLALEFRQAAGVKVRQPLKELRVKSVTLAIKPEFHSLILEELNVKDLIFDSELGEEVWLDTEIDEDLKKEGEAREFIRNLQEFRKKKGLKPNEQISLRLEASEDGRKLIRRFEKEIKKVAFLKCLEYGPISEGEELVVGENIFRVKIERDL